jgi:hypothetical protein
MKRLRLWGHYPVVLEGGARQRQSGNHGLSSLEPAARLVVFREGHWPALCRQVSFSGSSIQIYESTMFNDSSNLILAGAPCAWLTLHRLTSSCNGRSKLSNFLVSLKYDGSASCGVTAGTVQKVTTRGTLLSNRTIPRAATGALIRYRLLARDQPGNHPAWVLSECQSRAGSGSVAFFTRPSPMELAITQPSA